MTAAFTRRGDYALRAVIYLAGQPEKKVVHLSDISQCQIIPEKFLSKILQDLVRVGIVKSIRGCGGGYQLARSADRITFKEVIEAVEGPIALNACLPSPGECERVDRCKMHSVWTEGQEQLLKIFKNTTMADLKETTNPGV